LIQVVSNAFRKTRLTDAAERLVHLYEETGKPSEADKRRERLQATREGSAHASD
jgi:hypothetical protein